MRILLTGTSGQVGRALRSPLAKLGTVLAPTRRELDLALPQEIEGRLDQLNPELIVNPAAYTAVDRAEDESELAYRVNAVAPGQMARWAARRGVPLIHFSTDYVFDGSGHLPWRENDVTAPVSTYGASKLAGEDAVRATGGPHLIVRISWVYSNHGRNFMLTIARLAREREELRVVADQFGAPTSAHVIAAAVARLLGPGGHSIRSLPPEGDVIHVACSGETSWHGFASAILAGLKKRAIYMKAERVVSLKTEGYPTKARRPHNSRFDLSKLSDSFGISMPSWQDTLEVELDALAESFRSSDPGSQ
ncbi:dTDP-4-dehydrorhamnose reductase [Bradyrhizobium vignae]|uniref:dTDP-4-dehydrorhamnose reductase n=1 Tax=Bradyrhizobium vignae TaxID=1549949 RepID=A0A2U3Q9T3_9BRAD|nr:dTDP-4-dehydrorhamnose reductase [Bradyrhizobium vignae]SPP98079.1 dTDP-4-dehydrorhamnose reductase [Bradyrhizobium vignae]